jgi:cytochrome c biogenesis protein CcmG/thiol:disulfide interchange protein DsbE
MKTLLLSLALMALTPLVFAAGTKAPKFTLADAFGNGVTLPRKHDGADIYLFWASWCPYCKALMPHLQSMQLEYGENIGIYALHIRDDEDPVAFMAEKGYDFILLPEADPVMELYGVKPTPAVFIVDGQGIIRFNLYETIFDGSHEPESLSHTKRAANRAPYWAARIRETIDQVLIERKSD